MANFMMDIIRTGFTTVHDKKRITAPNDSAAILEANAVFAAQFADDPGVTGYRLRELRRRHCRVVRENQKAAAS